MGDLLSSIVSWIIAMVSSLVPLIIVLLPNQLFFIQQPVILLKQVGMCPSAAENPPVGPHLTRGKAQVPAGIRMIWTLTHSPQPVSVCSLSLGHTGLLVVPRTFQTHSSLRTCSMQFLLPDFCRTHSPTPSSLCSNDTFSINSSLTTPFQIKTLFPHPSLRVLPLLLLWLFFCKALITI